MSPWSENGTLLHMKDIEDVKYYMTYNVMITLATQIAWTFHSLHMTACGAQMTFHVKTWERDDLVFML